MSLKPYLGNFQSLIKNLLFQKWRYVCFLHGIPTWKIPASYEIAYIMKRDWVAGLRKTANLFREYKTHATVARKRSFGGWYFNFLKILRHVSYPMFLGILYGTNKKKTYCFASTHFFEKLVMPIFYPNRDFER